MPEYVEDDALLSRLNGKDNAEELTPEGAHAAELLGMIEQNPEILNEKPELREFYEVAQKFKNGESEDKGENIEKINQKIQEEFGYNTFEEFVEASKAWKAGSENYEQWKNLIDTTPPSFSTAISLYLQGNEDWNKAIALDTKVDFSKPANQQSKRELVKFYFPSQFTDEELDKVGAADADDAIKKSLRLAEGFFDAEHRKYSANLKQATDNRARIINAQKEALNKNKEALKKKYPAMTESQVNKLINTLTQGSYARHFLSQDGIFSEKAAENLIALELPDFYIKNIMGKKSDAFNKEKIDIITRSAEIPNLKGKVGQPSKPKSPTDITKALIGKRNTYTATPVTQK